jgi:hypothetical protein
VTVAQPACGLAGGETLLRPGSARDVARPKRAHARSARIAAGPDAIHAAMRSTTFAIKAEVRDPSAETFTFSAQKTMYGGKSIARGDTLFVFASENEGGPGLVATGVVTSAEAIARRSGITRQTPRVTVTVKRTALANRPLGRRELKPFTNWNDGRPETELNFKFYRQATNKIVGISEDTASFLRGFF